MSIEISVNGNAAPQLAYFAWAPSPCTIRTVNEANDVNLTLRCNPSSATAGVVAFAIGGGAASAALQLLVPRNGTPVEFVASGVFGRPSSSGGDTRIEVVMGGAVVTSVAAMVRVRKDAETLNDGERDRFLSAMARLHDQGQGPFQTLRDMHRQDGYLEAHRNREFLAWHRAYLLDLERRLQQLDVSVALPYWRFDQPAPRLFTEDFIGVSDANDDVAFSASNPLATWVRDNGVIGVVRRPGFDTQAGWPNVRNEVQTLAIGATYEALTKDSGIERQPHDYTHGSFGGLLSNPVTEPLGYDYDEVPW